jgi:O-antigen/teichoic acid export membrane protein
MKQIARSVAFSLLGFGWPVVIALISTPTILAGLGDDGYGIWSLVSNVLGYFVIFNSLQTASTKYLSEYMAVQDYPSVRKLLGTALTFNISVGVVGGAIIFLLARPLVVNLFGIPQDLEEYGVLAFQLASFGFAISTLSWWGTAVLTGIQRFDWLTGIMILSNTLYVLGSLVAVLIGWGVVGVVGANLASLVLSAGIYMWGAHRLLPKAAQALEFDWKMLRRIFAYGFYSTIHMVFGLIAVQIDRTLLGIWVGTAAVATYSVPLSIANRIHQLCAKALEVVFPIASGLDAQSKSDQLKKLFLRAQNLNTVLVILAATPLLILAHEILMYWISPDFADRASLVFQLLIIAYGLLGLSVVMGAIVAGLGRPEINTAFAVGLGLSNLLGYFLFMPKWGVNGAGLASVFGSALSVPIFLWYINRYFLKLRWIEILSASVSKPLLAGIIVGTALYFLRPLITSGISLFIVLVAAEAALVGITLLLGVWLADELALILQFWQKFIQPQKQ